MHKVIRSTAFAVVSFLCLVSAAPLSAQMVRNHPRALDTGTGSISLTTLGSPVTENFDTLGNTANSTTNTALPTGWYITETGGGARDNEQYGVDPGSSTTGDVYSYGAAASTERALGELRSGTLIPLFGAKFTNNTGATITSLDVSYTGKQWRFGGVHSTVADRLDFQYSLDATDLSTGTYLDANALDFNPPVIAGTAGALDGNAAANRTAISSTITGLSIPNGATFFIRFNDVDATGADDGLAVDDFSITANVTGASPTPTATATGTPSPTATATATATATPTVAPIAVHDIQGNGTTSPLVGQSVTTTGIVTALKSNGFFLQTPDANADADPNTSKRIFVFTSSAPPAAAAIGNSVNVTGTVQEFIPSADTSSPATTELGGTISVSLNSTGNSLPAPITITASDTQVNDLNNLEKYEGMRVQVSSLTVVAPTQGT